MGNRVFHVFCDHGTSGNGCRCRQWNSEYFQNLVVCFCLGLGNAGSIIVGNRLGADRLQEAKEAGGTLTRTAIIAGIVSGLVLIALSPFITKW